MLAIASTLALAQSHAQDSATRFLESRDPHAREFAMRELALESDHGAKAFIAALSQPDARLREAAACALGSVFAASGIEALVTATLDDDVGVRVAALTSLAMLGTTTFFPGLERGSKDDDWSVRRATALALGSCADERAVAPLVTLARDFDSDVRHAAYDALFTRSEPGVETFLRDAFVFAGDSERARIVERLANSKLAGLEEFLENVLLRCEEPLEIAAAAHGLAKRGVDLSQHAARGLVIRSALSNDPAVHQHGYLAMLPQRVAFASAIEELLVSGSAQDGAIYDAAALLFVELLGHDARAPLLSIARGDTGAALRARASSISALRRFRDASTPRELAWVYAPEQPVELREPLLLAFEDQPFTDGARSGLIQALGDPDSGLRLRAFAALLRYGAEDDVEMTSLLRRIANERDSSIRGRMARLVAAHAKGAGARTFVAAWLPRVLEAGTSRKEALNALENLPESGLSHEAARKIVEHAKGPLDEPLLRLLTRLRGDAADRAIANALQNALADGESDLLMDLTIALRHGGGDHCLTELEALLDGSGSALEIEAMRTLLRHDRPAALHAFERSFPTLDPDLRGELLSLVDSPDIQAVKSLFERLLSAELDVPTRVAVLERASELKLPLRDRYVRVLATDPALEPRLRAIDGLAAEGDAFAHAELGAALDAAIENLAPASPDSDDRALLVETLARALARLGALDRAEAIAGAIFRFEGSADDGSIAHRGDFDRTGGFTSEEIVLAALVELGAVAKSPHATAVALEARVEDFLTRKEAARRSDDLLLRLATGLENAGAEYTPTRRRLLEAALLLPPEPDRREVKAAIDLAGSYAKDGDHERAAKWFGIATRLIDLRAIDRASRSATVALGPARASIGFEPLRRLRGNEALERAKAARARGDHEATLEALRTAATRAPDDSELAIELTEVGIGIVEPTLLLRQIDAVLDRLWVQSDLLTRCAETASRLGDGARVALAHQRIDALTRCGLSEDSAERRVRLARARARVGDAEVATAELYRAIEIDSRWFATAQSDPLLAPLLPR